MVRWYCFWKQRTHNIVREVWQNYEYYYALIFFLDFIGLVLLKWMPSPDHSMQVYLEDGTEVDEGAFKYIAEAHVQDCSTFVFSTTPWTSGNSSGNNKSLII